MKLCHDAGCAQGCASHGVSAVRTVAESQRGHNDGRTEPMKAKKRETQYRYTAMGRPENASATCGHKHTSLLDANNCRTVHGYAIVVRKERVGK